MTRPNYHKACKAFVSSVNQRRADLIAKGDEGLDQREAEELRLLQESVGAVVDLWQLADTKGQDGD